MTVEIEDWKQVHEIWLQEIANTSVEGYLSSEFFAYGFV